jgi:hypothetical protein
MNKTTFLHWIARILVALAVIFCFFLIAKVQAQENEDVLTTSTTTQMYEYDGWRHKTTLRGNWDATERPPEVNDRLYEYEGGRKTGTYFDWNGDKWQKERGEFDD